MASWPTVERRVATRRQLRQLAAQVERRLPAYAFQKKVRAAATALDGYTGATPSDLGGMLELCAHARGPAAYDDECDALAAWLAKDLTHLPEVSESSEEEESDNVDIARTLCILSQRRTPTY